MILNKFFLIIIYNRKFLRIHLCLFYFSQQNHVTFRDDTVVIQSNNIDLSSSSSSSSSKRISITGGNISSNSILHNATSIHLHLCNAMKALLLISPTALVQFLPVILNQFMEIIILSAETSEKCFQQQQQQQQIAQLSDSVNKDLSNTADTSEYLWFRSLKNNNNNMISTNTTNYTTTTTITSSNNSTPDDVLKTAIRWVVFFLYTKYSFFCFT